MRLPLRVLLTATAALAGSPAVAAPLGHASLAVTDPVSHLLAAAVPVAVLGVVAAYFRRPPRPMIP